MAFQTNTASQSNVSVQPFGQSQGQSQSRNESWKADAFINLYLPTKAGGRRKLGSVPLKGARPSEADLLKWLQEDPTRVSVILSKLELDFQLAGGNDDAAFDLG